MAQTDFGSLTTQQKKLWSAYVFSAGRDQSFWMGTKGFIGAGTKDTTKPVHLVTELTKTERGDRCVMPLVQDLVGDGVVGDNDLENNEESLIADDIEIQIDQLRNGVKSRGRMSEQKTVIRFRSQAKDKLAYWKASRTDDLIFLTASGISFTKNLDGSARDLTSQLPSLAFAADVTAPSTNRVKYAGTATDDATLTAADKMGWNFLVKAKAFAIRKRLKPIRIKGSDHYLVVMSPEQSRDLKSDNDYKTIVANAGKRGDLNELFTGAFAVIDGLILYEHTKTYTTLGLTSSNKWGAGGLIDGARALLVGAQAIGLARVGDSQWNESDNRDYGNKEGVAYSCMIGMVKAKFKSIFDGNLSEDFSIIALDTAAAA